MSGILVTMTRQSPTSGAKTALAAIAALDRAAAINSRARVGCGGPQAAVKNFPADFSPA